MPQPPFKVDVLQLEPGSGQTLTIGRDAATGSLRLTDPYASLLLSQLASLSLVDRVRIVGKAGVGSAYTSIQDALDSIPIGGETHLILITPGIYTEDILIHKDGVHILGLGRPTIRSALDDVPNAVGNDHTITISSSFGTTPRDCTIEGLDVVNSHNNKAAVRVVGGAGSNILDGGLKIKDCSLQAHRPLWASTVGRVSVDGSNLSGSAQSLVVLEQVGDFVARRCQIAAVSSLFDEDQALALVSDGTVVFEGCQFVEETLLDPRVLLKNVGKGGSRLDHCRISDKLVYQGDQSHSIHSAHVEQLSILDSAALTETQSRVGTVLAGNPAAVFDRERMFGAVNFDDSSSEDVSFDIPLSGDSYSVVLEIDSRPVGDETAWVVDKAESGFTVRFHSNQSLNVRWEVMRHG